MFNVAQLLCFMKCALVKLPSSSSISELSRGKTFSKVVYVTMILNVLIAVACVLATTFQCSPISYQWKQWDGEGKGTCIDNNTLAFANAGLNIAMDLWVLVLPLLQKYQLNLHWKKKLGVMLIFGVGAL